MNVQIIRCLVIVATLATSTSLMAYELATHGFITKQAYDQSKLAQSPNLLLQLGLTSVQPPLSNTYYDFGPQTGNVVFNRFASTYEQKIMGDVGVPNPTSILGWIAHGAIREDDGGLIAAAITGEPYDDPFGNFNRFCNHFLDPITRNPLSTTLFSDPLSYVGCPNSANINAANWAMGTAVGSGDAFSVEPMDANTRNHFSIFAAREAMWRALTLRRKDGSNAPRPDILYSLPSWTKQDDRKAYWASAFRALGDVLHLNQDMAQPQHTRNEGHGLSHSTLYEKYVDARATQDREFKFDSEGRILASGGLPPLPIAGNYPVIPSFNRYSDFWSTDQSSASILAGKGLADYSSRGFFTPAKNLGTSYGGFPNPVNNESVYTITTDPISSAGDCTGYAGRGQYARGNRPDDFLLVSDPATPVKYASRSLIGGQWTLNRCVFEERVNLLIPRAVAYSAGLIDYFFRGQLEITPPAEGIYALVDHFDFSGAGQPGTNATTGFKGFKTIKLKLRNTTPDIVASGGGGTFPQIMPGGTLVAVLKFIRNKNYTDDLTGESIVGGQVALDAYNAGRAGQSEEIVVSARVKDGITGALLAAPIAVSNTLQTYVFEFDQELPINVTDVQLQVVYRGVLGAEADAVVVQTVDISEPTYFTYMNATDYIKLGSSVFTRAEINAGTSAGAALRGQVRPTACIDSMTDQLKDIPTCFQPYALNYGLKWGNASGISATVNLPNERTYHRFAMLLPPTGGAVINPIAATCGANTPIPIARRRMQTNDNNSVDLGALIAVRGVRSFNSLACINIGDNAPLGADDRDVKMAPLTGANLKPVATQSFTFGAP